MEGETMFKNRNIFLFILVAAAISFYSCTSAFYTPLQQAAMKGDVKKVQELLDKGANINEWKYGTPLMFAASEGKLEVVKLLVSRGADLNAQAKAGWTALGWAAMNGHQEVVDFLIVSGADINIALNGLQEMKKGGWGKADKIDAGYKMILNRQGWAFLNAGKYEQALEAFKQAVTREPIPDNLLGLSYAYYSLGKYDDSIMAAQMALKVNSNLPYAHASLARSQMAKGNYQAAVASFQKATELSPNEAMLRLWLGRAYLQAGNFDEGIKEMQKAAELAPTEPTCLIEICYARIKAGQWDEAVKAADRALGVITGPNDKANVLSARAIALREKGATEEAASDAQKSLEISRDNELARTALAAVELDKGNYEEVLKLLAGIKDSVLARILEATAYAKLGKFKEAGEVFSLIGDMSGATNALAIKNFQKLQEIMKPQVEAALERARQFEASGQILEALNEYAIALKLADPIKAKEIRSYVAPFLKKKPQFIEIPEEARKYTLRAEVLLQEKKIDEALKEYQKALQVAPLVPQLYYSAAMVLGELKNYRLAINYMNIYLELYPEAPNLRQIKDEIYKWEFMLEREGRK